METKDILNILKNPAEHNETQTKEAGFHACKLIERQVKMLRCMDIIIEEVRKDLKYLESIQSIKIS